MATLIEPSGAQREITPADGVSFTLRELQEAVGGCIELITLQYGGMNGERDVLIVNEDGLREQLPPNPAATTLAAGVAWMAAPGIVGTVIRCRFTPETEKRPERMW